MTREIEPPDTNALTGEQGRRDVLKKMGVGAAVAWTAPTVLSLTSTASAGSLPPPPPPPPPLPIFGAGDLGGMQGAVMSSDGTVWVTPDQGNTWSRATTPPTSFAPVAVGAASYDTVDGSGTMWFASNGFDANSWVKATTPPTGNPTLVSGFLGSPVRVSNAAGASSHGSGNSWTADASPLSAQLPAGRSVTILAGGGNGVAFDNAGGAYLDNGGSSWSTATTPPAIVPTLACGGIWTGNHVALDGAGGSAYSTDSGANWAAATTSIASLGGRPTLLAGGGDNSPFVGFAAFDAGGNVWFTTDGGNTWAAAATSIAAADPGAVVTAVVGSVWGNSGFVYAAVGTKLGASRAWYSQDSGSTWIVASTPPT